MGCSLVQLYAQYVKYCSKRQRGGETLTPVMAVHDEWEFQLVKERRGGT